MTGREDGAARLAPLLRERVDGDRGEYADDHDHDHELEQGEPASSVSRVPHGVTECSGCATGGKHASARKRRLLVGARWRTENGEPIYDRRVHLTLGETWLVIIGEAPIAEREFCEAYIDHVLASLRMRES